MNRCALLVGLSALVLGCGGSEGKPRPDAPGALGGAAGSAGPGASGSHAAGGAAGLAAGGSAASQPGELSLPIEVLGDGDPDAPVIVPTTLSLSADPGSVHALFVTCHRCGFYDAPEHEALSKPLTTVKASLRIA